MPESKQGKCTSCGQPIKTVVGAIRLNNAPVVCRRCFGEQSYAGPSQWSQSNTGAVQQTTEG